MSKKSKKENRRRPPREMSYVAPPWAWDVVFKAIARVVDGKALTLQQRARLEEAGAAIEWDA